MYDARSASGWVMARDPAGVVPPYPVLLGTLRGFRTSRDGLGRAELVLPHAMFGGRIQREVCAGRSETRTACMRADRRAGRGRVVRFVHEPPAVNKMEWLRGRLRKHPVELALSVFGDVRPGETATV